MNPMLKIFNIFFVWRLALFIPVILGGYLLGYGTSHPFFEITYYKVLPDFLNYPIFTAWSNFDGVHYLNIATNGYITEARFFPLLSVLISIFSLGNINFSLTYIAALILSNVIFIAALVIFYKLLRLDYPEKASFRVIINLLIFPASFFFASIYTEGLFLLLAALTFYLARKRNWIGASLTAMLLLSTRFVGIFIIPALIYEYILREKPLKLKNYLALLGMLLISSLGLILFSVFNFIKWGSFTYFLSAHSELDNGRVSAGLVLPLQTLYRYFKILTTIPMQFEWGLALLEVIAFAAGFLLLITAWKKKVRTSYLIFGALTFLLPSFSGTFSGLPRYLLVIFPIFIALSLVKSKFIKILYYIISGILLFLLLMFFSRGHFVA